MRRMRWLGCVLILGIAWAWAGCSGGGDADRTVAKESSSSTPAPDTTAATAATPAPDTIATMAPAPEPTAETPPKETPRQEPPEEPSPEPAPAETPAPAPAAEAPAEELPAAEPPAAADDLAGKVVAVAATKEGLTYVGAAKCKICHKVQDASWAESAHAKRTPPLDCEGCHGPGSEYKSLKIMKDLEAAKAAGLVIPDKTFCVQCHRTDWQDDMLARAHAHKGDAP